MFSSSFMGSLGLQHRLLWDFKDLFLLHILLIQMDQNAILDWLVAHYTFKFLH